MNQLILGIITIVFCSAGYFFAWKYYRKEKFHAALMMILLGGLLLRLFTSADSYLHTWDERYHALVAKNMIDHPLKPTLYENPVLPYKYSDWVANHVWLEKGPVPLWAMSVSIRIFGNSDYAIRFPSLILSLLAVYLTFLIGSHLFDKKVGLLAAFFHSINGLIIEVAAGRVSSDHVETFFIFFIELAVLLSVTTILKKRNLLFSMLIGAITGLAFLSKWTPALIVFPVWIIGEWLAKSKTRKQLLQHLFVALLAFFMTIAPWLLYVFKEFPDEAAWIFRKFTNAYNETVEQHTGPFYHYFQNLGMVFGEIIWIPLILSFYQLFKRQAGWKIAALNAWWLIPFVIFSFAATKRHTYLLLASPAIFVLLSYYWFYIRENNLKNRWVKNLLLFLLIALPVRYCIERTKPFINVERNPAWATELKQMKNKFDANTVFFNYEHAIEGMYYTDYTFYTRLPRPDEIADLERKGYSIVVKKGDTGNE